MNKNRHCPPDFIRKNRAPSCYPAHNTPPKPECTHNTPPKPKFIDALEITDDTEQYSTPVKKDPKTGLLYSNAEHLVKQSDDYHTAEKERLDGKIDEEIQNRKDAISEESLYRQQQDNLINQRIDQHEEEVDTLEGKVDDNHNIVNTILATKMNKDLSDTTIVSNVGLSDYVLVNIGGVSYRITFGKFRDIVSLKTDYFKGYFKTAEELPTTGEPGDYAFVGLPETEFRMVIWDNTEKTWEMTTHSEYVDFSTFNALQESIRNGSIEVGSIQGNVKDVGSDSPTLKNLKINGIAFLIPDIKNIDLMFSEEHIEGAKNLSSITFNGETWNVVGSGGGVVDEVLLTSITPDNIVSTKSEDIILNYLFERENDSTKSGIEKIFVNGALKSTRSISQGNIYSDITKLLSDNANTVEVQVTSSGITASLIYNIEIIELSISSNFDGFGIYQSNFTYRYTPIGNISKTIHFILDDVETTTVVNENNKVMSYGFTGLTHGTHKLNVYATADVGEKNIKSNTLKYSLAVNTGEDKTIIACPFDIEECKQGDLLTFNYVVCDPNSLTAPVTIYVNDEVVSELTVDRTKQTWSTRNYPAGQTTFKIVSNDAEFNAIVNVEASEIVIEPITHDLELYLTANGRSNNEAADVRGVWTNNNVESVLSNFNWKSNGWVLDKNGDTVLRVNGGASVYIPLNIFANDFRGTGKTIEFEFATRDILDYDSILISCEDGGRGFTLSSSLAIFASEQTTITTKFKEDEKIRLAFVVEPTSENCLVYTYVNGIISGLEQYPNDEDFTQNKPVGISIGSVDATIDIYNIRVYGIDLDHKDILKNYTADTQDNDVKLELHTRNDIFDSYGNINYQKVLQQIPCLTIIGELPGSKGDKKTVTIEYKNNADNTKDFKQYNSIIDIQGTSSQYYPRKNYKFELQNDYQLTNDSIPEKVFCIKADFMESSHSHNTGLAKIVNKLYPTTPPKETNTQVQAAITGFPIVVWHKASEDSISNCLGVYNFNNDKDDVNTFGYTLSFPNCESWEFKNNTSAHCLFQDDNFVDTVEVAKNFEARYPEDYKDYTALSRVVSWVYSTQNDLDKFKNEFESYFNKEATLLYYCLTEVFAMVDSRAKNLFLTTWDGLIWYPTFYDMDTAFGLNNEGVNDFSYNVEYHDTKGSQNVFNGESSVLWNNFEQVFAEDITELYNDLRNNKLLTYDSVMDVLYGEQISKICESNYNYDAIEKYRDPLLETGENKLFVAQGSRLDHLKWWLFNRLNYMDSKYVASDFKENYMTLRIYTPETYGSIVPNADITITPYADQYVQVKYDENAFGDRGTHDEAVTIEAPKQVFNDTPLIIYGASRISDIGDLSPLYAGTVDVAKGVKLKKLIVGNKASDYSNTNLKELTVGNNELLKVLDVRNCPSLTHAIDVSGCTGIEEIYATGTSTTAVKLPNGGNVKKLHLPDTITNLTILNQLFIEEFVYSSLSNVSTLHIENSNVDKLSIVQQAKGSLARVRLLNVDWSLDSKELLDYLMTCKGIGDTGLNIDKSVLTGKVHINGSISQQDLDAYNSYWGATNLVVTADRIAPTYICNFYNYDGTLLYTTQVVEGGVVNYSGDVPTKPKDDTYYYEFNNWTPNTNTPITKPTDFTAQFTANKLIVIKWLNYDGTELQVNKVLPNESVYYIGTYPTRPDDAQYKDYVFGGWVDSDGETYGIGSTISAIQDVTLTAQFTGSLQTYNVYWMNGDNVLEIDVVEYGSVAEYNGETPTHSEGYMFTGWSRTSGSNNADADFTITGDTTFYPVFDKPDTLEITVTQEITPSYTLASCTGANEEITIDWGDGDVSTYTITTSGTVCEKPNAYTIGNYTIKMPATENYKINSTNTIPNMYGVPSINYKKVSFKYFRINTKEFFMKQSQLTLVSLGAVSEKINLTQLPESLFWGCSELANVVIPNGITRIQPYAFKGCSSLTSIHIPSSVQYIYTTSATGSTERGMFAGCNNLTSLTVDENNPYYDSRDNCNAIISVNNQLVFGCKNTTIPTSVTSIGEGAFYGCKALTSITIPTNITSILKASFLYCSYLKTITMLSETPPTLSTSVFEHIIGSTAHGKAPLQEIRVPASAVETYKSATNWSVYADIIVADEEE